MDANTSKAQLLAGLTDEQAQWEALLSDIGEDHMTQPGVAGEWSVKDIVAHITAWRRRTVSRFQAALHHQPIPAPPWPSNLENDDEINAWFHATDRDRSLTDVLSESRAVYQQLYDTLAAFPEEELANPTTFPWLSGEDFPLTGAALFGHFHEEHEADMRAYLARIRQEEN